MMYCVPWFCLRCTIRSFIFSYLHTGNKKATGPKKMWKLLWSWNTRKKVWIFTFLFQFIMFIGSWFSAFYSILPAYYSQILAKGSCTPQKYLKIKKDPELGLLPPHSKITFEKYIWKRWHTMIIPWRAFWDECRNGQLKIINTEMPKLVPA